MRIRQQKIPPGTAALFTIVMFGVGACSHPIEIVGGGDVTSATGTRNCYLEDYVAGKESCARNLIVREYRETYYAVPRAGWKFERWENYCVDSAVTECSFNVTAGAVKQYWGAVAPPLVAVFSEMSDEVENADPAAEQAASNAAEQEAARGAAEQEAARLAAEKSARKAAAAQTAKLTAEQEAARLAAEKSARIAAEQAAVRLAAEKSARLAAEQEAARQAAAKAARVAADQEAARKAAVQTASIAADQEAARLAAEKAARLAQEAERLAAEKAARLAAEDAARKAAQSSAALQPASIPKGTIKLHWSVPGNRQDGSPLQLAELVRYEIYLTSRSTGQKKVYVVSNPLQTSYMVTDLQPDNYSVAMLSVDKTGLASRLSQAVNVAVGD